MQCSARMCNVGKRVFWGAIHLSFINILKPFTMAKFDGIFEIQGTLKGMTFYKSKGNGSLIRTKGGVSKKRIMNDPAFERTRENGAEFKSVAQDGQLIRKSTGAYYRLAKDSQVVGRMMKILSEIKKLDETSVRGERCVQNGMEHAEGKNLLKGFEFNRNSVLAYVLRSNYQLDTTTGTFAMADFVPKEHLYYPEETTHVQFSIAASRVHLENGTFDTVSSTPQLITMTQNISPLSVAPASIPGGDGFLLFYLLIEFKQEINGTKYPLKNNAYNVLHVLEVM